MPGAGNRASGDPADEPGLELDLANVIRPVTHGVIPGVSPAPRLPGSAAAWRSKPLAGAAADASSPPSPSAGVTGPTARPAGLGAVLRGPRLLLLAACALALVALWETASVLCLQPARVASEADWGAAQAVVRRDHRPGDLIAFAPLWLDPLGRYYLGDLIPLAMAGRADADRYSRIWQVSTRGAHHPDVEDARLVRSQRAGALEVRLYEKEAAKILYDFVEHLRQARVARHGGRNLACPWSGDRFACGETWNNVRALTGEVSFLPRRCIYAHPADGAVMMIAFPAVPLGREIAGHAGMHDFNQRYHSEKKVHLEVVVAGKHLGGIDADNQGFPRFRVDTSRFAGQRAEVVFEVTAPEGAYSRPLCFAAEAREEARE